MGSQTSSRINNSRQLITNSELKTGTSHSLMKMKDYSSYKGVKSIISSDAIEKTTKVNQTRSDGSDNDLVEQTFEWHESGNMVYLTGSFVNWKQWFLLTNNDNRFIIKLPITKTRHLFKFIVDKEWKCSSKYAIEVDENQNSNNVIDLSHIQENSKDSSKQYSSLNTFSIKYPRRDFFHIHTAEIPNFYREIYDINYNSMQNHIGSTEFYCVKIPNYNHSNCSFQSVIVPSHINL